MDINAFKTILVYVEKKSRRIVRAIESFHPKNIPTSLTNYEVRFVTSFIDPAKPNLIQSPADFIFHVIHGLQYLPDQNFDLTKNQLLNIKLQTVESLWRIANAFIINAELQYFNNHTVREILEYEIKNEKHKDIDSLFVFLKGDLDDISHETLINLKNEYIFQKKKDITKNILISQERIMESEDPVMTLFDELKEIYIKY